MDSHSTCKYQPTIDLFQQHNILVFVLPAHSSTILQPLDLTVNGEFKQLMRKYFKPVQGENKPTKHNRLLYIAIRCLQGAFLAINITDGFARAGIHPYCAGAPLNSGLVRDSVDEINFQPTLKKKRGPSIAGKILTNGSLPPMVLSPPNPSSSSSSTLQCLAIAPMKSASKITPVPINNLSLNHFVSLYFFFLFVFC